MNKFIKAGLIACTVGSLFTGCRKDDNSGVETNNSTLSKSNFKTYHPCGVAVSSAGVVAISTYEGDTKNGKVAIWKSFSDFNSEKSPDYIYENINDPEAVVFDTAGNLYIADTYNSKIYYTTDISKEPADSFSIGNGNPSPSNPRGMTFDANGKMYVMCENISPEISSYVQTVTNPTLSSRTFAKLTNSEQSASNALDLCLNGNTMFITDYKDTSVKMYSINFSTSALFYTKKLHNAGGTLNVVSTGNNVYFTNDGGYLIKWDTTNDDTKNILIGTTGVYAPWGVALYSGNLLVADAAHNKVLVINPATANWQ
jgi:hypothetical protein